MKSDLSKKTTSPELKVVLFGLLWLFIGTIASLDMSLAVWAGECINEQNPILNRVLQSYGMCALAGTKMAGTIFGLGALIFLYHYRVRLAWGFISIWSLAQFVLLFYLFS